MTAEGTTSARKIAGLEAPDPNRQLLELEGFQTANNHVVLFDGSTARTAEKIGGLLNLLVKLSGKYDMYCA